ncbi:hypothetical protein L0F63_003275 [Massospora cicadina]|nr:hypothetical protein L0F63_003275 [Massospora cicadina]
MGTLNAGTPLDGSQPIPPRGWLRRSRLKGSRPSGELVAFLTRHQVELSNRDSMLLPLFQQSLADTLAEHLLQLPENLALLHLECFWLTLIKEWPGIDRHRLDKFMLLERRFVNAGFRLLQKHSWAARVVSEVDRIFREGPLHPTSSQVSDAIRYHVIDVYLTELKKALPFDGPAYGLHLALGPALRFFSTTTNKAAYKKVQDTLLGGLMAEMAGNPNQAVFQHSAAALAKECYKKVGELTQLFNLHSLDLSAGVTTAEASHSSIAKPISTKRSPASEAGVEPSKSTARVKKNGKASALEKGRLGSGPEKALQKTPQQRTEEGLNVGYGFRVFDLPTPVKVEVKYEDGEVDPLSRFRVFPLGDIPPAVSRGDDCVATHDVYVEDILPEGARPKRVRWNLDRNHIQTFVKGSSIPCVSNLGTRPKPARGLLKASSLPIRLNRKLFEVSSLGLPACLRDPNPTPHSLKQVERLAPVTTALTILNVGHFNNRSFGFHR